MLNLRDLESGTYILYGKFHPYSGSTSTCTFSTGMVVSVIKTTATSYIQVYYAKNNTIQYLEITDESYSRNDAKLINMESTANKVTDIDETADDTHYPSAKAVYDVLEIKRIENLDRDNPLYFRDIESGYYIFHGYFRPYPNSASFITMDTMYVSVARVDEGSHLMSISPLNFRMTCYEILVDDTAEDGFTYTSTRINLLDVNENANSLVTTIDENSDDTHYPSARAVRNAICNTLVVDATSTDGITYTAEVDGITELYEGLQITIRPDISNTSNAMTLNVNGLGDKPIRRPLSFSTYVANSADSGFLHKDAPCRLMYHANYPNRVNGVSGTGIWLMADKVEVSAQDLYGRVPVASGGVPSSAAADEGKILRVVDGVAAWSSLSVSITDGVLYLT